MPLHTSKAERLIQPKYEFWLPTVIDGVEVRPVYFWGEGTAFYHAGERAPPLLRCYMDKVNRDFGLEGRHKVSLHVYHRGPYP